MAELRYPNITGRTDREKLEEIRRYLFDLVDQMQHALNNVGTSSNNVVQYAQRSTAQAPAASTSPTASFSDIKALIIKSADIVDAYYQEISSRLKGVYVSESDFGAFREDTEQYISQSSTDIEQLFTNYQQLFTEIDNLEFTLAEVNAYIRSGLLYYDGGVPVYGLEIGQVNTIDGVKVFDKYARFTADRLSFYDQNGTEVAYISDYKLYIRNVEIKESFQEGGYKDFITANGGVVTKWVGGV